ncbi:CelD/BcsL family acetyltransferase involved in cellulose biosynthesis [Georgenia soli]|uniref:CelD/BcsL family acetyltransferase involved in cellulose biosynthesis n=1 Tax=Georgenia soli TaxID=638953 RepID=A0A2A9EIC1_9MICO|nr:CelD/BcsL family acetyltransferase involved in cellulose biosynthesis [Georgenia soli]
MRREDDFDFTSDEYEDLYNRAGATPFQHGRWLTTLYETLAPRRGARKLVVTVRDDRGRLVLALPMVRRREGPLRLLELADLGVNDYAAPLLDPQHAALLAGDGLARRVRSALGGFDLLRIERVVDSPDPFLAVLAGARAKRHAYSTHLIELAGTVEEWRAGLPPPFARHLERKYKRLRPKGERRLRVVTDPAEVGPAMDRLRRFRAARFAERRGTDLVQEEDFYAFYCAAARHSVRGGPGRLVVLEVGGEAVAVAFDLVDGTGELFLLVGYDVERLRNYSLGLLIVDELVRDAIGQGRRYFDLTVGDEPYKADFGARPRPLFEIRVARTPLGVAGMLARDGYLLTRRTAKRAVLAYEERRRSPGPGEG